VAIQKLITNFCFTKRNLLDKLKWPTCLYELA